MRPGVFGRVWEHWQRLNPDRKPTILFGPDVAGSIFFAQQFAAHGVPAAHIDAKQIWVDGEFIESSDENRQELLRKSESGEIVVLCNRFCLDSETEILTSDGWIGKDQITCEHQVANWDNGRIFFDHPKDIIRRPRAADEKMVVLETPRRSIRVTDNHDLLYRTTASGGFLKAKAADLVGRSLALPVSGNADALDIAAEQPDMTANMARRITMNACAMRSRGHDAASSRAVAEARLRERASLRYKQPKELTLEECQFIGYWIGDGNRNHLKQGGIEYRLWQTRETPNILSWIDGLCCAIGVDFIRRERITDEGGTVVQWSIPRGTGFGSQKRRGLFCLEPYLTKTGSDLLWGLNAEQFVLSCEVCGLPMGLNILTRSNLQVMGLVFAGHVPSCSTYSKQ